MGHLGGIIIILKNLQGKVIYIFGIDGSGKTTMLKFLTDLFVKQKTELFHSYSNGGPFLKTVDKNDYDSSDQYFNMLHALDHFEKSERIRSGDAEAIKIVERYYICNWVYCKIFGLKQMEGIELLHRFLVKPDIYIFMKVSPNIAYKRILERKSVITKKESLEKLVLAEKYYKEYIDSQNVKVIEINTNEDLLSNQKKVISELRRLNEYYKV